MTRSPTIERGFGLRNVVWLTASVALMYVPLLFIRQRTFDIEYHIQAIEQNREWLSVQCDVAGDCEWSYRVELQRDGEKLLLERGSGGSRTGFVWRYGFLPVPYRSPVSPHRETHLIQAGRHTLEPVAPPRFRGCGNTQIVLARVIHNGTTSPIVLSVEVR